MDFDSYIGKVLGLIYSKMQDFGANKDFFENFDYCRFSHNHIQCLMTTQDFRILKDKGVQEHKIQGFLEY